MKFGSVPVAEAVGATAVHSIRQGDFVLKKGTLIGPAEVAALKTAGVKEITVARLDPGRCPQIVLDAEFPQCLTERPGFGISFRDGWEFRGIEP